MNPARWWMATLFGLLPAGVTLAQGQVAPEAVEFFERRIRPVLVENCTSCHGDKRQQGGLRLDSRAALLKGSDTGPVVVPGEPDRSVLVQAVRYTGELKMPPKGKMPPEAIEALTQWVKLGAPWPDSTAGRPEVKAESIAAVRQRHWSFQSVRRPAVPALADRRWVRTPIDAFILKALQARGMEPSPPADRRTLVRRLYFDLVGLPPTPEQMERALADDSDHWWEKLIDELLASPHYGERWGRHWLDVARYADTKGYVFNEERRFPYAYTYRDYVIRSFNEDVPYDQFVREQLAADLLPPTEDRRHLAAMGFLTLGRRFLNNSHDIIDDRIDVTMRGLQGLTVACARCHDHKFDPIPTRDYYSLYGVFASSVEPRDLPLTGMPERTEAYLAWEKELAARQKKLDDFVQERFHELLSRLRSQVGDYLLAVRNAERLPGEDHYEALNPGDLHPEIVRRWQEFLVARRRQPDPVFGPWHDLVQVPAKDFAAQSAARLAANRPLNPLVARALTPPPASLRELAQRYGQLFADIDRQWLALRQKAPAEKPSTDFPDPDRESLRQLLYGRGTPLDLAVADVETRRLFDRNTRNQVNALKKQVDEWKANTAVAPPRAMVLHDLANPIQPRVFLRGNPNNLGEPVPRQFLEVLAGEHRRPFGSGSGRLELARAIASRDNPLTARVLVNRLWLGHFGQGLVRTPSDFGLRGEPPTHPDLLDFLADYFMEHGWSVKQLHRLILQSNVYRQASAVRADYQQADPDNRLWWRMNRRRLEFEPLRDALLAVAGRLDRTMFGPPVEIAAPPYTPRRTIYGFIERQNLPGVFRTFDFASPDTSTPQRFTTTVPPQALFLMNSPFVIEQARHFAARPEVARLEPARRIEQMYLLAYGRTPEPDEVALGLRFLESAGHRAGDSKLSPWEKYAQVLLLANEFAFVD
jgi:hypothetical protein